MTKSNDSEIGVQTYRFCLDYSLLVNHLQRRCYNFYYENSLHIIRVLIVLCLIQRLLSNVYGIFYQSLFKDGYDYSLGKFSKIKVFYSLLLYQFTT